MKAKIFCKQVYDKIASYLKSGKFLFLIKKILRLKGVFTPFRLETAKKIKQNKSIPMKTELVKFNEAEIVCVIGDFGKIDIVIKPICEHLGLNSNWHIKAISDDEILGAERSEHTVQVGDDQPRKMVCLPLEFLNGWLFQIKFTNTMSDEKKAKLVDYKRKCYKALFHHFFGNMKKQIETNEVEIALLEQLAKYNEDKAALVENVKKAQRQLASVRDKRLKNEPTLF
jgi:hypothetical protein